MEGLLVPQILVGISVVTKAGPGDKLANAVDGDAVPASSENGVTTKEVGVGNVECLERGLAVSRVKAGVDGTAIVVMGEVINTVGLAVGDVFNVTADV